MTIKKLFEDKKIIKTKFEIIKKKTRDILGIIIKFYKSWRNKVKTIK